MQIKAKTNLTSNQSNFTNLSYEGGGSRIILGFSSTKIIVSSIIFTIASKVIAGMYLKMLSTKRLKKSQIKYSNN